MDTSSALFQLYCCLIAIELALKDDAGSMRYQHDVIKPAKELKQTSIDIAADSLNQTLQQLWCTDKFGNRSAVPGAKYPNIRYLRHENDFPGDSPQADLDAARDAARTLLREINYYWKSQKKSEVVP